MKANTRQARPAPPPQRRRAAVEPIVQRTSKWPYAIAAAAFLVVIWAYSPALHGPFLFDDAVWQQPGFTAPLVDWIRGGVRPVLYFTYWVNAHFGKDDPYFYHVFNVLFHCISSGLVFLIVRRLVEWSNLEPVARESLSASLSANLRPVNAPDANLLAGFAGTIFLLHPVQSEAVAYLAGRSDALCTLLLFAAFTLFLYRRETAITWSTTAAVLFLFGLALLSKEQAIVLPALLLLTDFWWNPGFSVRGVRANWKIYVPMAIGAAGGIAFFWNLITRATSAGFALKDFTWYQYFFTQCRALLLYIGMFLLPVRLTLDWDFPISRTILDHGAILGLLVLAAAAAAAWHFRRRFPLATYGFLVYLVLMAPTSSILPIQDPVAERRLYASMLGLLLILVEILARLRVTRRTLATACVAIALLLATTAHSRAALWSDPVALWQDTVSKSPNKARPHFHLGMAYFDQGRYDLAISEFEKTAQLQPVDYNLLVDWGLAYDALDRVDIALAKLEQAAAMDPTPHIYTQIAQVYAKRQHWALALEALDRAEKIDGSYPPIHVYRGNIYFNMAQYAEAIKHYQRALQFQPDNEEALRNLVRAQQLLRTSR